MSPAASKPTERADIPFLTALHDRLTWLVLPVTLLLFIWFDNVVNRRDAERLLARMWAADQRFSYTADLESRSRQDAGSTTRAATLTHTPTATRLDEGGRDGATWLSTDGVTRRYDPQRDRIDESPDFRPLAPVRLSAYHAHVGPGEDVAGRKTNRIRVSTAGYARDLWLDRQTGLLLRARTTRGKAVVGDVSLSALTFNNVAVDAALPEAKPRALRQPIEPAALSAKLGAAVAPPTWLPAGYRPLAVALYHCPDCQRPMAEFIYSNGLDALCVYIALPGKTHGPTDCAATAQADHAWRTPATNVVARTNKNGRSIIVVGEMAERFLTKVANSVS